MRNACAKRVEAKKRFIVRGMVRIECEEKAKGEEECLVGHEIDEISL
jgi:DTW domain-containing protein YfiP